VYVLNLIGTNQCRNVSAFPQEKRTNLGLLGRCDVSRLGWSRRGTRATGSGENSSSGSNEGEFHELNEFF
jgi:hypothetical protein